MLIIGRFDIFHVSHFLCVPFLWLKKFPYSLLIQSRSPILKSWQPFFCLIHKLYLFIRPSWRFQVTGFSIPSLFQIKSSLALLFPIWVPVSSLRPSLFPSACVCVWGASFKHLLALNSSYLILLRCFFGSFLTSLNSLMIFRIVLLNSVSWSSTR